MAKYITLVNMARSISILRVCRRPITVVEIVKELGFPISCVYGCVKILCDMNLLAKCGRQRRAVGSLSGHSSALYISRYALLLNDLYERAVHGYH